MKILKVLFCFSFFIFYFPFSYAQTWNWVNDSLGGDPPYDHICASDDIGNCYVNDGSITIIKFDNSGHFLWKSILDSNDNSYPNPVSVAIYPGYAYLGGSFLGRILVGTDSLISTASTDIFIAKIDSNGVFQWAKEATPHGFGITLKSIACDGIGNVFATGTFADTIAFDHDTLKGQYDAEPSFLVKYDANGNVLWAEESLVINSVDQVIPASIAVDKFGNAYVTGEYHGSPIFGNDTFPQTNGSSFFNFFTTKFDPNGNILWISVAQMPNGSGRSTGTSVSVDGKGNSYVGGAFWSGTLTLGHSTFGPVPQGTPFIAKFNSAGNVDWAIEGVPLDSNQWQGNSVAADSLDNIYFILQAFGSHSSYSLKFGPDSVLSYRRGPNAIFQFDSSGNATCGALFSEGSEDDGDGVCVSPSGKYVYVAGDLLGTAYFGPDTLSNSNFVEPLFVASWKPCGQSDLGVGNVDEKSIDMQVYPNPSTGQVTFAFGTPLTGTVEIYNMLGEKMYSQFHSFNSTFAVDLSSSPDGLYLYRVINQDGTSVGEGKVVIQK